MYDARTNLSNQVVKEVKKYFGDKVYKTVIPRNVRLSEAPSYGMPITEYDPRSKGAKTYEKFTKEFLKINDAEKKGKINGVWFEKEYQREYPYGSLASAVVGLSLIHI